MRSDDSYKEIDEVKDSIINYVLIIGSTLGSVAYLISLIDLFETGFRFNFVTDFIAITIMVVTAINRKKIKIRYRSLVIIFGLFLFIFVDTYVFGMYSSNKILLIIVPLFSILVYSLKRVIIIFSIGILGFLFIGFLYIKGIIVSDIDYLSHSLKVVPWVVIALIIIIVSLIIVIVFYQFNKAFVKLINNLKEKNIEIAQREKSYKDIFDSSTDAIFIHDMQGNILDVNSAMLNMYEYDNIESINVGDLSSGEEIYTAEKSWEYFQEAIKSGVCVFDWQAKKKSGDIFWVDVSLQKTYILGNERILAIVRDNDEKKKTSIQLAKYRNRLEELVKERTDELESANEELTSTNEELYGQRQELQAALEELQRAQRQLVSSEKMSSLGVLAAGVAHEINNPLNFIQGGVFGLDNIFSKNPLDNNDEIKVLLDAIKEGVIRATAIVSSLNHFSRQDDSDKDSCNIHNIIDNCIVMLGNKTKNRIDVVKNFTTNNHFVIGNEGKLHQALLNIISNSVQAIPDKGEIEIQTEIKGSDIVISIKDSGVGISEEDISKIYNPFFTTKDPGQGTGLGLSITHSIIEEHLGAIEYKSEVNVGTIAIITLPL